MIVDLRPGAAGMIGAAAVAKSAADGYTVLLGAQADKLFYCSTARSITIRRRTWSRSRWQLAAGAGCRSHSLPAKSVREFIALAKAKPGEVTYGTAGHGTTAHLAMEYLQRVSHVSLTHVTYRAAPKSLPP